MANPAQVENDLSSLIEPVLAESGLELVELALRGAPGRQVLRLDIDRAGESGVTLDDCQQVSRALSPLLDESDLLPGAYLLEVSSPGVDRPIRSADDFRRNTGRRIVVTARDGEGAERSRTGKLLGFDEGLLLLETEGGEQHSIPLDRVVRARQEASL